MPCNPSGSAVFLFLEFFLLTFVPSRRKSSDDSDEMRSRDRPGRAGDVDQQVVGVDEGAEAKLVDRNVGVPAEGELRRRHDRPAPDSLGRLYVRDSPLLAPSVARRA